MEFRVALGFITNFLRNPAYKDTVYDNIAKNYYAETEKVVEKTFVETMQEINALIEKEELLKAWQSLSKIKGTYGIEWIEKQINDKLNYIDTQKNKIDRRLLEKESRKCHVGDEEVQCPAEQGPEETTVGEGKEATESKD